MELQHINVKLYLQNFIEMKLEAVVPVFHEWIQKRVCEELLIDVADYRHVQGGPGVVLIGHEANYSVDNTDNRLGIRYNRKAALQGTNHFRFSQALRAALQACQRIESDERLGQEFRFNRREIGLFVNDRMLAPNPEGPSDSVRSDFRNFFKSVVGDDEFELTFETNPRSVFGVEVRFAKQLKLESVLAIVA